MAAGPADLGLGLELAGHEAGRHRLSSADFSHPVHVDWPARVVGISDVAAHTHAHCPRTLARTAGADGF